MNPAAPNLRFWMSGEIEGDVYDAYDKAEKTVETEVAQCIQHKDYGGGLRLWAYLAIILDSKTAPYYPEVKRYSQRKKEVEFRLKINHQEFLEGSPETQLKLMAESVLRSLYLMPEIGVKDVDLEQLTEDVTHCLYNYIK